MWKTLIIGKEGRLTLEQNWLVVTQGEAITRVPIEDLYSVVIDNRQSLVSIAVLTEGSVRAMVVTEKQYAGMYLLLGDRLAEENYLDDRDMMEL